MTPPSITPSRQRGVIRLDLEALCSPGVEELAATEFRTLVKLWALVARHGTDGEIALEYVRRCPYLGRRGLSRRTLERFLELGLLEEAVYDDTGEIVLVVAGWRQVQPLDPTSAERKRRFRRGVYGPNYYGTNGEVAEVHLGHTECEVERLTLEGRRFLDELGATERER